MKRHVTLAGVILGTLVLAAAADERVRPTREQADAIRRLRSRVADMPVPDGLERRMIRVGDHDRMTAQGIDHGYHEVPRVGHDAAAVLAALAKTDGDFYRLALDARDAGHRTAAVP